MTKAVSKKEANGGKEGPERVPPLLPGREGDTTVRPPVEVGQPRGPHVTPIAGDSGRQGCPSFCSRLSRRPPGLAYAYTEGTRFRDFLQAREESLTRRWRSDLGEDPL
jgi:hypothetical protein